MTRAVCLAFLVLVAVPEVATAQAWSTAVEPTPPPPPVASAEVPSCRGRNVDRWSRRGRTIGLGLAGVTTAFLAHEMGHILTGLAYGVTPQFRGVRFLIFPFFTISSGVRCNDQGCFKRDGTEFKGGRRGKYFITADGFNVGHLISEVILTKDPRRRCRYQPFQKGALYFNIGLSFGYSIAAWAGIEPESGDVGSMAEALQINRNVMAALVFLPAALDLFRYLRPESKWAPWVSRSGKLILVGIGFVF